MQYLLTYSIICAKVPNAETKEENVLFNDALNTFYLQSYSVDMVKDHSDRERERKPTIVTSWATFFN